MTLDTNIVDEIGEVRKILNKKFEEILRANPSMQDFREARNAIIKEGEKHCSKHKDDKHFVSPLKFVLIAREKVYGTGMIIEFGRVRINQESYEGSYIHEALHPYYDGKERKIMGFITSTNKKLEDFNFSLYKIKG